MNLFERMAHILTLLCVLILPLQTRYIFWSPLVGTSFSEFGKISIYGTMILACAAAFFWYIAKQKKISLLKMATVLLTVCIPAFFFFLTFPSPVHAWILNVFFSALLGYATYHTTRQHVRKIFFMCFSGLGFSVALGVFQMLFGWSPASTFLGIAVRDALHLGDSVIVFHGVRILRMYGFFPHPNIFGAALALILGAWMSIFGLERYERSKKIFFFIFLCAIMLCISRSAALAVMCGACVSWGIAQKGVRRRALIGAGVLLPLCIWGVQFIAPSMLAFRGQSFSEQRSLSERVEQIHPWAMIMAQEGMWGTGIYGYEQALARTEGGSMPAWAYQPMHNVFFLVFAEVGVVGIVGMVGLGCLVVYMLRKRGDGKELLPRLMLMAPFLGVLWSLAWFDHLLWTSWSGMAYTATAIGVLVGSRRKGAFDSSLADLAKSSSENS